MQILKDHKNCAIAILQASCAITLIWAADLFFYNHHDGNPGLTIGVFLTLLAIFAFVFSEDGERNKYRLWIACALIGLGAAQIKDPSFIATILSLAGIVTLSIINKPEWRLSLSRWAINVLTFAIKGFVKIVPDTYKLAASIGGVPNARTAGGWAFALALSFVFIILFATANPLIAEAFDKAGRIISAIDINMERVLFWILFLLLCWPLLRPVGLNLLKLNGSVRYVDVFNKDGEALMATLTSPRSVGNALILFNIIFFAENVLDAVYLYGGRALPAGFTYASYAHKGAYTLIFTALLAGAIVLFTMRPGGEAEKNTLARRLVYLWIAQNVFLVLSSAWRTIMYIEAYSLTLWRVSALIWMALVVTGLILLIVRIAAQKDNTWLVNTTALALITVLYVCSYVNIRGHVADFNVTHSQEMGGGGEPLDVSYLARLGPESLPALLRFSKNIYPDGNVPQKINDGIEHLRTETDRNLSNWRGWTLQRNAIINNDVDGRYLHKKKT